VQPFCAKVEEFIKVVIWIHAKTMPLWPHEYIVRDKVDMRLFMDMVRHIREFGYRGSFYNTTLTYFEYAGFVYRTMGAPIKETTIINRCRFEDTYSERLKNGTLP
jgi:hypothetical protein